QPATGPSRISKRCRPPRKYQKKGNATSDPPTPKESTTSSQNHKPSNHPPKPIEPGFPCHRTHAQPNQIVSRHTTSCAYPVNIPICSMPATLLLSETRLVW